MPMLYAGPTHQEMGKRPTDVIDFGKLIWTHGIHQCVSGSNEDGSLSPQAEASLKFLVESLKRHASGDWGDCCKEDQEINDQALKNGMRLLSVYHIPADPRLERLRDEDKSIWIITESDRQSTTILFPREY